MSGRILSGVTGTVPSQSGKKMANDFIRIHPSDDVAVALRDIAKNTEVEVAGQRFTAIDDIPKGHKMALRDLRAGENILKYGSYIGHVTADVPAGSWLHSHNVETNLDGLEIPQVVVPDARSTLAFASANFLPLSRSICSI